MAENGEALELIKMINLVEGQGVDERLRRWAEAFEAWLEGQRTGFDRSVGSYSYHAWRELLAFTGRPPWEVGVEAVNAYVRNLEERGLSASTIVHRLMALASFYDYCQEEGVDPQCGPGFNPAAGVQRPKIVKYEKARYLSEKEEAALLEATQRDDSPIGKRDYALILTLLRTGWKAGRVRELRWGDGERRFAYGSAASLVGDWERGSGAPVVALSSEGLPAEVWEAICDYLEAAGRWEGIREEEYVFVPLKNPLVSEWQDRAEDWEGGRPLSQRQVHALVKQHAEMAGLRAGAITCHTLQHTAGMRRLKMGESPDAAGVFLGRKGKRGTRAYLRKLDKSPKGRLKARRGGQPGQLRVRSRKPHRFQRKNHWRLTHGLRARYLPEFELLAEKGIRLHPADAAVLRWRIVARRAAMLWDYVETLEDGCRVLKVVGQACVRVAKALKFRQQLRALARELDLEAELLEGWGEEEL